MSVPKELKPLWVKPTTREAGDLTFKQLVEACSNIGFDLTCGACAELFYTGHLNENHDEDCKTLERRKP